jgi:hypothetical protein
MFHKILVAKTDQNAVQDDTHCIGLQLPIVWREYRSPLVPFSSRMQGRLLGSPSSSCGNNDKIHPGTAVQADAEYNRDQLCVRWRDGVEKTGE